MKSTIANRVPRISRGRIFFWSFTLALSVGLFFFVQRMTACWQLTALPGSRPDFCHGEQGGLPGAPDISIEDCQFNGVENGTTLNYVVDLTTRDVYINGKLWQEKSGSYMESR